MVLRIILDLLIYLSIFFIFLLIFQRLTHFRHMNSWRKDIIISLIGAVVAILILFIVTLFN